MNKFKKWKLSKVNGTYEYLSTLVTLYSYYWGRQWPLRVSVYGSLTEGQVIRKSVNLDGSHGLASI